MSHILFLTGFAGNTVDLVRTLATVVVLCPVDMQVNVSSSLISRGQNWHLVLVQNLLVLKVKDLEQRGWMLALADKLVIVRELLE